MNKAEARILQCLEILAVVPTTIIPLPVLLVEHLGYRKGLYHLDTIL